MCVNNSLIFLTRHRRWEMAFVQNAAERINRLRLARMAKGLSQRELELRAGLPKTTCSHFEAGRRIPDAGQRLRIAMALECQTADLFPDHETTYSRVHGDRRSA